MPLRRRIGGGRECLSQHPPILERKEFMRCCGHHVSNLEHCPEAKGWLSKQGPGFSNKTCQSLHSYPNSKDHDVALYDCCHGSSLAQSLFYAQDLFQAVGVTWMLAMGSMFGAVMFGKATAVSIATGMSKFPNPRSKLKFQSSNFVLPSLIT